MFVERFGINSKQKAEIGQRKTLEIQEKVSHGCTNAEKAQWVFWTGDNHGIQAMYHKFQTKYRGSAPACSIIRRWYEECQSRSGNSHMGGNEAHRLVMERKK